MLKLKRKTKRKILKAIIPCVLVAALASIMLKSIIEKEHLNSNKGITTGTVTFFARDQKGLGGRIHYQYNIKGVIFENVSANRQMNADKGYLMVNKSFPVVYDTTKPGVSVIVTTPAQFENYSIELPDSLKWIRDLMSE
ncbi:hypothetical protein KTO58_08965 [Chitinophaga pendula]|uniref:hypothetical protein n=1 Tax=Chitinophaga TaxID=79328 RepID=UPI000BAF311C|nr:MULTISPECIES: hypothetical protein [Chitinophaga]ASZ13080.1 hypothetical protein CK934_20005 [Chitinophaga sp. MD30]UCJ09299.1 hypothetical protein KTO58_08965 [Chitinophaga pendula]